jgi:geranylgeranyl diphosphate/geranylgeranyl-bacteriochlorophyllide a reductase
MFAFVAGSPLGVVSSRALSRNRSASSRRPAHVAPSMKLRVAVVGGGPAGACAAEILAAAAKNGADIETYMFERKMDNAKPCGGAIPLCMIEEFDLPAEIIDRKVRKMKMISPTNVEVNIGQTLKPDEYIGMLRREVMDKYLRDRAIGFGATPINGLVTSIDIPETQNPDTPYTIHYTNYEDVTNARGAPEALEVDLIIGADGANSRVAKAIDAGDYNFAIAFQERIKIPDDKMAYYEELAEMYVGDDVSPDFYAWVFPKYDHVGVGTGTVINRPAIKQYQQAIRDRAAHRLEGGKIIKIEAHPIPEHPRPRRVVGRVALVGDAAGYVTKCSGEGIYFAAKSGRMAAEAIVALSENGSVIPTEAQLKRDYLKVWDNKYWATYKVLDLLQAVFYRSDPARESFVKMCEDEYVQRVTFDSYLYKTVTTVSPIDDIKLLFRTAGSLINENLKATAGVKS